MNPLSTDGEVTLINGTPWYERYADYVRECFLASSGKGFSYDNFMAAPNRIINRAEFAWLFAHAVPAFSLAEVNAVPDDALPNVKSGTEPYCNEIYMLYLAGIVNGSDKDGSFLPASNIKRSEVAAIAVRMMEPEKRVGPPANLAAAPAVDLNGVIAANRLSVLAGRHGTVKVHTSDKYFETDSWFFLDGGTVVKITESISKVTGALIGLNTQVGDMLYSRCRDLGILTLFGMTDGAFLVGGGGRKSWLLLFPCFLLRPVCRAHILRGFRSSSRRQCYPDGAWRRRRAWWRTPPRRRSPRRWRRWSTAHRSPCRKRNPRLARSRKS